MIPTKVICARGTFSPIKKYHAVKNLNIKEFSEWDFILIPYTERLLVLEETPTHYRVQYNRESCWVSKEIYSVIQVLKPRTPLSEKMR